MTASDLAVPSGGTFRWSFSRPFMVALGVTAVPVAVQSLFSSTRTVVDSFLVSHLGTDEVAAVGYSGRVLFAIMLAAIGMADGGAVVIAQFWGSGSVDRTRQATALTLAATVAIAATGSAICFSMAREIMSIGTTDPVVIDLGVSYLRVAVWMIIPFAVITALAASLRSLGHASIAMRFTIAGLAVHVGLAWCLIFGHWGLPRLGMTGAAWATLLSTTLEAAMFVAYVYSTRNLMAFGPRDIRDGVRAGILTRIRRVGVPVAVSSVCWALGILMYSVLVGRAGTLELAALAMVTPIESIAIAVANGIATASAVLVGTSIGEGARSEQIWRTSKALLIWSTVAGVAMGLLLMLTWPFMDDIYGGVDPATLDTARDTMLVLGAVFVFRALAMTLQNGLLRGGGDTVYILGADLACQWLVAIPLICLTALVWHLPFPVIFLAIYSEEIAKTIISGYRVSRRRWMRRIVED